MTCACGARTCVHMRPPTATTPQAIPCLLEGTKADLHEARAVPEIEAKGWADVNGMIGGPTRAYLLLIPHHIPPDLDQDWHTTGDSRSTFCVGYGLGSPLRGIVIPGPNLLLATDLETSRETQWVFSRTVPPPRNGGTQRDTKQHNAQHGLFGLLLSVGKLLLPKLP